MLKNLNDIWQNFKKFSQQRPKEAIVGIIIIAILLMGLNSALLLSQQNQEIRRSASTNEIVFPEPTIFIPPITPSNRWVSISASNLQDQNYSIKIIYSKNFSDCAQFQYKYTYQNQEYIQISNFTSSNPNPFCESGNNIEVLKPIAQLGLNLPPEVQYVNLQVRLCDPYSIAEVNCSDWLPLTMVVYMVSPTPTNTPIPTSTPTPTNTPTPTAIPTPTVSLTPTAPPLACSLKTDFNQDYQVNNSDLELLIGQLLKPCNNCIYDVAGPAGSNQKDGQVDAWDYAELVKEYGNSCPQPPEPTLTTPPR